MKINQPDFKHKYIKYKNKYLHLKNMNNTGKQSGGEVLSIIGKKNLQSVFYLDFEKAYNAEFIDNNHKFNDAVAIEVVINYDYFLDDLENMQKGTSDDYESANYESDDSISDNSTSDNSTSDDSTSDDGIYYEQEDLDVLRQIDIDTWKIKNIEYSQYYLVKLENDDTSYLLKIMSGEKRYEFIKNMKDYDAEYGKLKKMENLLSPQYLFKDDNNIVSGYIMNFNEELISLDDYLSDNGDEISENVFLKIMSGICECYINILRCGMKPCVKNSSVMILDSDTGINIFLTGMDELVSCVDDIEEESIRDIVKLINVDVLPRELKESNSFKKIFDLSDFGLSLKKSIFSVKSLMNLIKQMININ